MNYLLRREDIYHISASCKLIFLWCSRKMVGIVYASWQWLPHGSLWGRKNVITKRMVVMVTSLALIHYWGNWAQSSVTQPDHQLLRAELAPDPKPSDQARVSASAILLVNTAAGRSEFSVLGTLDAEKEQKKQTWRLTKEKVEKKDESHTTLTSSAVVMNPSCPASKRMRQWKKTVVWATRAPTRRFTC